MLLRPYRVLIRFIPLFAVLIAASQVTAQQKAPIPPASPKSEDRDTSASKPLATGESTQSPPAESAASNSSGPPWVELSDFAMRQEGLGSVFSVNYRLVEGTPEPGDNTSGLWLNLSALLCATSMNLSILAGSKGRWKCEPLVSSWGWATYRLTWRRGCRHPGEYPLEMRSSRRSRR